MNYLFALQVHAYIWPSAGELPTWLRTYQTITHKTHCMYVYMHVLYSYDSSLSRSLGLLWIIVPDLGSNPVGNRTCRITKQ
jgi:hypothetical protein